MGGRRVGIERNRIHSTLELGQGARQEKRIAAEMGPAGIGGKLP